MSNSILRLRLLACGLALVCHCHSAVEALEWTFADGKFGAWSPTNATLDSQPGPGLHLTSANNDPMLTIELDDVSIRAQSAIEVRMSATAGTAAQLFWGGGFNEADSVSVPITADGKVHDYRLVIPRDLAIQRLRFDPTNAAGSVVISAIKVPAVGVEVTVPPGPFVTAQAKAEVRSGAVRLALDPKHWQTFDLYATASDGRERLAATSIPTDALMLLEHGSLDLSNAAIAWNDQDKSMRMQIDDAGGAAWSFVQRFTALDIPGAIAVDCEITVDRERKLLRLPIIGLCAGNGSFGVKKHQAVFPGVEYLEDEPSSNKLEIETAESARWVPAPKKICFPFMAVQADGVYAALAWDAVRGAAALFDSPARKFTANGHVMALSLPAVGPNLRENSLIASTPFVVGAKTPITFRAYILGGAGADVTSALKQYLQVKPAPEPPPQPRSEADQLALFGMGYTRSTIAADGLWRHAHWARSDDWKPLKSGDSCAFLTWLAMRGKDAGAKKEWLDLAAKGLAKIDDGEYLANSISHIVPPVAPLLFGNIERSLAGFQKGTDAIVKEMHEDGTFTYDGPMSRTHYEKQAVGVAAPKICFLLYAYRLTGEESFLKAGLKGLEAFARFDDKVPRGAQVWEVPMHAPDIMGSSAAIQAYLHAYELTGKQDYLERAIHWAWTGVPFIYLDNPEPGRPVGLYASTAVFGATQWSWLWIGRPVQWCGMMYSYELYRLADYDRSGPWRRLAEGITVCALQEQYPSDSPMCGLLPDAFELDEQQRNPPNINPGVTLVNYACLVGNPLYSFKRDPVTGALINSPCAIEDLASADGSLSFTTAHVVWERPYRLLINHMADVRSVMIDASPAAMVEDIDHATAPSWHYDAARSRLIVLTSGAKRIVIEHG